MSRDDPVGSWIAEQRSTNQDEVVEAAIKNVERAVENWKRTILHRGRRRPDG